MTFQRLLTWTLVASINIFFCCNGEVAPVEPEEDFFPIGNKTEGQNWLSGLFKGAPGSFYQGFFATFSVILVSELGDKTFFIAAILAMNNPRWTVYIGAMSALTIMHIMSSLFGYATVQFIPPIYTYYASAILFAIFGLKMLFDAWKMTPADAQEEINEVQEDIRNRENAMELQPSALNDQEAANQLSRRGSRISRISAISAPSQPSVWSVLAKIFISSFTMTFLAEWGDRSQFATIALAASENVYSVISAGIIGHGICTGIAVLGGRMIAQKISVRTVTAIGGIVFLGFAVTALILDPPKQLH